MNSNGSYDFPMTWKPRLQRLWEMRERTVILGIYIADVPADMNCLTWAVRTLIHADPSLPQDVTPEALVDQQQIRENLKSLWLGAARMQVWQYLFRMTMFPEHQVSQEPHLPEPPSPPPSGKNTAGVKVEPLTPERTSKVADFIDLDTPPSGGRIDKVIRAGQCRPAADFGQAPPKDFLLFPAGSKEGRALRKTGRKRQLPEQCRLEAKPDGDDMSDAADIECDDQRPSRKSQRTCKTYVPSQDEVTLAKAKEYLFLIGATHYKHKSVHSRMSKDRGSKGTGVCKNGGYMFLSVMLFKGSHPERTCSPCKALLDECLFSYEDMRNSLATVNKEPDPLKSEDDELPTATVAKSDSKTAEAVKCDSETKLESEAKLDPDGQSPFDYVMKFYPVIELLPAGSHGRTFPFRCNVCRSTSQPQGKIGELGLAKAKSVKYFLDSHVQGRTHKANVALYAEELRMGWVRVALKSAKAEDEDKCKLDLNDQPDVPKIVGKVHCDAIDTSDPRCRLWHTHASEIYLWVLHSAMSATIGNTTDHHSYNSTRDQQGHPVSIIRHMACRRECKPGMLEGRNVCDPCLTLMKKPWQIGKSITFSQKYWIALLVNARLLGTKAAAIEVEDRIRATKMYLRFRETMDKFLDPAVTSTHQLLAKVREEFNSVKKSVLEHNDVLRNFIASVVKPCLDVDASSCSDDIASMTAKFARYVASGKATDLEKVNFKIATSALSGQLNNHPFIQGLSVLCIRKLGRLLVSVAYTMVP
jgi:hypothetical protein